MITKYMSTLKKPLVNFKTLSLSNRYSDILEILGMFESVTKIDKTQLKSPVLLSSIQMFSLTPQCSVNLYSPEELITVLLVSSIDSSNFDLYNYLSDVYTHYKVVYDENKLKDFSLALSKESFQSLDSFIRTHKDDLNNIKSVLSEARPPRILVNSETSEESKFLVSYFAKEIFISDPCNSLTSSIMLNGYLASGMFNVNALPNSCVVISESEILDIQELLLGVSSDSVDFTSLPELSNPEYPDIYYSIILLECVNIVLGGVLKIE